MDLFLYVVAAGVYLMVIHFAMAIRNEFNLWFMSFFFVLGAVIGGVLHSYESGFIFAVIMTLMFW